MYASSDILELAGLTTRLSISRLYAIFLHFLKSQDEVSTNNEIVPDSVDVCVPSQLQNGTEENCLTFHGSHARPPLVKDLSLG